MTEIKLSDEQVQKWRMEYMAMETDGNSSRLIELSKYIAHKAYAAGLEEAAKHCQFVANCYGLGAKNPNLGVVGEAAMLHKQAAAMDCYNAIRALPISEG